MKGKDVARLKRHHRLLRLRDGEYHYEGVASREVYFRRTTERHWIADFIDKGDVVDTYEFKRLKDAKKAALHFATFLTKEEIDTIIN